MVVLSPPGTIRPSRPSRSRGVRTSRTWTDGSARRSIEACSAKSPWTASTPIVSTCLPAASRELRSFGERAGRNADHRLAQALGDLDQDGRVLVMRRGFDDGRRAAGRIAGLEDARADEDALGAELH